jgi:hypothetical protein
VLTDPLAVNLRNAVAHGTREAFDKLDAALLLHITCLIVGLGVQAAPQESVK